MKATDNTSLATEAYILTGGLSSRMGRDKSRVWLGQSTMPGRIRAVVSGLGFRVRTIRRDALARCGPIGGIYTALKRSRADIVLVLACDMPFVPASFLRRLLRTLRPTDKASFAREKRLAGFPCLLRRQACLPLILQQIERGEFSIQKLAQLLKARRVGPARNAARNLANINTPEELEAARRRIRD